MAEAHKIADRTSTATDEAHAKIGGFLTRCSVLDYRAAQLIARWFCTGEKQKYLSYVLHSMEFEQKRQIVEERLTAYHPAPELLRETMAQAALVEERRRLVAKGLLAKSSDGTLCVKSYAGGRFLSDPTSHDIIPVDELALWSQTAVTLAQRLIELGDQFDLKIS